MQEAKSGDILLDAVHGAVKLLDCSVDERYFIVEVLSSGERMTLDKRFLALKLSLKLPNGLPALCGPDFPGLFAEDESDEELADKKEKSDGMEVDLSSAMPLASNASGARSPR
eukprot:190709-Pleurochrysis_carterae.AAC.1